MKNANRGQNTAETLGVVLVTVAVVIGLLAYTPGVLNDMFDRTFNRLDDRFGV